MTNFNYSNSIARLLNAVPIRCWSPTISDRTEIAQRKLITIYFGSGTWARFFLSLSFTSFMHKPSISPWPVSWKNFAHAVATRICLKQKNHFISAKCCNRINDRHEIAVQFWWTDVRYTVQNHRPPHYFLRVSSFQLRLITNDHITQTHKHSHDDDFYEFYFQCK